MILRETIEEMFDVGLKPIPIIWDEGSKVAKSHTIPHSSITSNTKDDYNVDTYSNFVKLTKEHNGVALKLFAPFGMIDIDLKNTEDKELFNKWKLAVDSQNEDILSKVCYEKTRNDGFHIYIKYSKLRSKISLAKEENGDEVIALYTGGVLSYCDPTPGYNMLWNSFEDLEELTDDEFSVLISTSEMFNKYAKSTSQYHQSDSKVINGRVLIEYPTEYENACVQFDRNITDEVFEDLLNEMTLFENKNYRYNKKDNFLAYLRKGSKANFSAKVFWKSRRVLLFTSSLSLYPSYMDRVNDVDHSWVLSPSRIIYYKNDRDWIRTMQEIQLICDSADIVIDEHTPVTDMDTIKPDRLKFPVDVFPVTVQRFLEAQRLQYEYLAGGVLGVLSTCIGNTGTFIANAGYVVKPILYIAIVAPPGASKTPSLKTVYKPLEMVDSNEFEIYKEKYKEYKRELMEYKQLKDKSEVDEPEPPQLAQTLIKDATIEKVINILSYNDDGCCLLADELSGFLKRMNQYSSGDELQKWLELWSGSPILVQRITREADKVENPFCTIVGGIQPGVLETLSSDENQHNGFYHRFLFVYPEVMDKLNWANHEIDEAIVNNYYQFVFDMIQKRQQQTEYRMNEESEALFKEWFDNKNKKYNIATNDNYKGIIAKYQDYCLRFALIIQYSYDCDEKDYMNTTIKSVSMERAIRLTEYFFGSMHKSIQILAPENPAQKLTGVHKQVYKDLPPNFTMKTALEIGEKHGIKKTTFRVIVGRWAKGDDAVLTKEGEQQHAIYQKIY